MHNNAKASLVMALARVLEIARTVYLDLRYSGSILRGNVQSRFAERGAFSTVNSDYKALSRMFKGRIMPRDVLVDVGCGKGRVVNWWLSQDLRNQIVGLELDPEVAADTARRFAKYPNVRIIAGDAVTNLPPSATLLYLYNPFNEAVMSRFKAALTDSDVTIVYYNPEYVWLFQADQSWKVTMHSLTFCDNRHNSYAVVTRERTPASQKQSCSGDCR